MPGISKPFRLDDWTVFPDRLVIEKDRDEKHLEPKAMATLVYLAEHAGETVSRETLIKQVWPDRYGSDEALSRIISLLRGALGDSSRKPKFIETVPKAGYRLKVSPDIPGKPSAESPANPRHARPVGLAVVAVVLVLGFLLLYDFEPLFESAPVAPVTTEAGYTIAVQPFRELGLTSDDRILSAGLTNEIISNLNRSSSLRIVARDSQDIPGQPQGARPVDYFLAGSIARVDDRLQIYAEIIDTDQNLIVWSDSYQSPASSYLSIQQQLSERVFSAISDELNITVEAPLPREVDLDAYTAYLNGIFLSKLRGEEPLRASIEAFSEALTIDPGFDQAKVALAHARVLLPYYSDEAEYPAFLLAISQLDGVDEQFRAEAEAIRGFIAFRQWRWLEAEEYLLNALALDPDLPTTHVWYSQFLSSVGRLEESLAHANMAFALDSISPVVIGRLATAQLWSGQDEEAGSLYANSANLGFNNFQNPGYLILLMRQRDYAAVRQGLRAMHPDADLDPLLDNIEFINEAGVHRELVPAVDLMVAEQRLQPRLELGVWLLTGQWDRVIATIEKYQDRKKYLDIEFLFARESEGFRNDPLFAQLTESIGLEDYWQQAQGPDFRLEN